MEVITTHLNADFDAMASMVAAKKLYPEAILVFPGSQERTLREFFVESAVYLFDFKRLRDLDLERIDRLILVDTRQLSRIGKFKEIIGRPDLEVHIYDHHPDSEDDIRGSVMVIEPVGATVTLLTRLIREKQISLTPEEATILSIGIFEDTGSFTFNSTTPEDFEAAAHLRRCGAELNVVADVVTHELDAEQVGLLNELLHSSRKYVIQDVEVCIATASVDKYVGDFALVVHKLRDMENLNVLFALARMEDRIYLVARSRIPEVNAGTVAAHFGGGGHSTAASATIKDLTLIQVEDRLFEVLQGLIRPSLTARSLMSHPVIHVDASLSVGEAAQTMVKYNINAMPILEKGNIVGLINRQILEKAIFHGLEHQTVREYMSPDFATVTPDAPIWEIQKYLVGHQQRILPVEEDGKLVGVVTRRDLLNFLIADRSNTPTALHEDLPSQWEKRKNVSAALAEQLSRGVIQLLRDFGELAERLHFKAYAVGGFIRDLLLRRANMDIDIVVEGDGIQFARAFAQQYGIRARAHKKFNTAVLIFVDGLKVDVATARMEYYQYPAALPVVEFGSLKMDLYRRDFTMNTLALALNPNEFGQLIDFFGGHRDVKDRVIRVLHNLSFVEDPTRILRAIRFEQRFGFRIGKQTASLMRNAVRLGLIQRLGGQRLLHELQHILREENPLPAIERMADFKVMAILSPAMKFDQNLEQLFVRLREVILWYQLSFLEEPLERWWVYFLGLLSNLPREHLQEVFDRLDLFTHHRERIVWTYTSVDDLFQGFFRSHNHRPSDIYHALQHFGPEELLFMMAKADRDETRRIISHYFNRYRRVRTELKGRDLKAIGLPPGPIYRILLNELLDAQLNGEVKNRQEEIAYLKTHHPEIFKKPVEPPNC